MASEVAGVQLLDEYIGVQSISLIAALIALLYYASKREKKTGFSAPGPKGWPLLGILPSLDFHSEWVMNRWSKEYGPVCRIKMGGKDVALLGSLEAVQEAFVKRGDCFSNRTQNSIPPFFGNKGLIFINYDDNFKEQRHFGLKSLREFGMGRRSIEPNVMENINGLCDKIAAYQDKPVNIDKMVYETVSSVISKLVFNRDIPAENETFKKLLHEIVDADDYSVYNGVLIFFPSLKHFPAFRYIYNKSVNFNRNLCANIEEQIRDHKKSRCRDEPRDIIDCFLNEMETARRPSESEGINGYVQVNTSFIEEQLVKLVRDLFLAGSETTSTTFYWLLLYVSRDPKIQEKLRHEIDSVVGDDIAKTSIADQLPYTKAVIQETLRIRPVAPIGIPHAAGKDSTILGYHVPKGTLVIANIFRIHHDEEIWKNPDEFNPDRHLDAEGKFVKHPHVMPFCIGARQCLGQQLANMELYLLAVTLFQRFSFKLLGGDKIDMKGKNIFTLRPVPFEVIAEKR